MSINEGQIFVRCNDFAAVQRATEAGLQQFFEETYCRLSPEVDDPEECLLSEEFARVAVLLPPERGWCAILDGFQRPADEDLAREISRMLRTRVVCTTVEGRRYFWEYRQFDRGRMARCSQRRRPAGGGTGGRSYRDVEAEAYAFLLSLGIPPAYALLDAPGVLGGERREGARPIEAVVYRMEGLAAGRPCLRKSRIGTFANPPSRRPPVRADRQYTDPSGRKHYEEIRCLPGRIGPEEVGEILSVELDVANRYAHESIGAPDAEVPAVRFRYSCDEMSDDELNGLIAGSREEFFASHLTMREFLAMAERILRDERGSEVDVRRDGFSLICAAKTTGRESRVHLENLYRDYRRTWSDPAGLIRTFISRMVEIPRARVPETLEEAKHLILPQLIAGGDAPECPWEAGEAVQPFVGNLRVRLVLDCGGGLIHVPNLWMEKWKVTFDSLWNVALRNLEALAVRAAGGVTILPLGNGRILVANFPDGHTASRVLLPRFHRLAAAALGSERLVVGLPGRDSLSAVRADQPPLVDRLQQITIEAYGEESHPLSPDLFAWDATGLNALHTVGF
ncbi:MAG: hypothetical protein N3A38_01000 [Planctomycetota bacterium]|nr:hypothetical protein [Planctomycetota bacterium]